MKRQTIYTKAFVLITLVNTALFLNFNMSTAGFPLYVSESGVTTVSTGLVTTLSAMAALIIRPLAGAYLDKKGNWGTLYFGIILLSSPVLVVLNKSVGIVFPVRILQGFGWGLSSTACSKMIANSLPKERLSEGIGYAGLLSSIATAFAPSLAIIVFERANAYAMFMIISLSSMLALIVLLTIGTKTNDRQSEKDCFSIQKLVEKKAMKPAWLMMSITLAYSPMVTFLSPYVKTLNIDSTVGFFVAYAISTMTVRPLTGVYIDRKNGKAPVYLALGAAVVALILIAKCRSNTMLILSGVFAGLSTGAGMNALQTFAIKESPPQNRGVAVATFLFGFDLGMALGALIAGILVPVIGFRWMFSAMALPSLIGWVALAVTKKSYS